MKTLGKNLLYSILSEIVLISLSFLIKLFTRHCKVVTLALLNYVVIHISSILGFDFDSFDQPYYFCGG